ncbi:MAG: hypothetical protein H3C40_14275 [Ignavibacterium sp.]|nr:hypothetical protein [Ignavibacterium sp.]
MKKLTLLLFVFSPVIIHSQCLPLSAGNIWFDRNYLYPGFINILVTTDSIEIIDIQNYKIIAGDFIRREKCC